MSEVGETFDAFAEDWDAFYSDGSSRSFEYRQRKEIGVDLVCRHVDAGGHLLEVGCGAGHAACALASSGYRMTCLDPSEQMLSRTQENFARAGLTVSTQHGTADAASGEYDGLYAFGVIDYIEDLDATLRKFHELLVDGGALVLSFSNRESPAEWLEAPVKRALSRFLRSGERVSKLQQGAGQTYPRTARQVEQAFEKAGFRVAETRHLGFGLRFGNRWVPPRAVVERTDAGLASSRLRRLGRTFFMVGIR